jgi:hypothetical protein
MEDLTANQGVVQNDVPTPTENLKKLYNNISGTNGFNVPYDQFQSDMQNEDNLRKLHGNLLKREGFNVPYDQFKTDMWGNSSNLLGSSDGFGTEMKDQVQGGSESLLAGAYGIPGYAFDFIGAGFRGLGIDVPRWKDSWGKEVKVGDTDINPLSYLEKAKNGLLQRAKQNADEVKKINPRIEEGVLGAFEKGDALQGFRNMASAIAQSAPSSLAMGLTGGMSTAAQVGSGAALFGSQSMNEADQENDYGKVSRDALLAITSVTGAFESVFETTLGSGAVGKSIINLVAKKGEKGAVEELSKTFASSMAKKLIEHPWLAPFGEAIEEMGTQVAQNAVNKYTGYKPETNVMDGVWDAGMIGAGMGTTHGALIHGVKKMVGTGERPTDSTPLPTIDPRSVVDMQARELHKDLSDVQTGNIRIVQEITQEGDENTKWFVKSEQSDDLGNHTYLVMDEKGNEKFLTKKQITGDPMDITEDDFAALRVAEYDQNEKAVQDIKNNEISYNGQRYTLTTDTDKEGYIAINQQTDDMVTIPFNAVDRLKGTAEAKPEIVTRVYGKSQITGTRGEDGSIQLVDPMTSDNVVNLIEDVKTSLKGSAKVVSTPVENPDPTVQKLYNVSIVPNTETQGESATTPTDSPVVSPEEQPQGKKIITQSIGGKTIDLVEEDGFDEVVPSDKMPLEKALPALEKKFGDHPKFKLVVEKEQIEVPGETKYDDPVKKTVIKSIRIVPKSSENVNSASTENGNVAENGNINLTNEGNVPETTEENTEVQDITKTEPTESSQISQQFVNENSQSSQNSKENSQTVNESSQNVESNVNLDNIDTDNFIYVTHQTDQKGAASILKNGFDIRGGLNGTTLFGNKESIQRQIQDINEGRGHRGSDRMFVFAFPKSEFQNVRQLDQISDQLIDNGQLTIPSQYIFDVHEKSSSQQTQTPQVSGTVQGENAQTQEQGQGEQKGLEENVDSQPDISTINPQDNGQLQTEGQTSEEVKPVSKDEVKIKMIHSRDLVNSENPVENKLTHDGIKRDYKELLKLIDCLWQK